MLHCRSLTSLFALLAFALQVGCTVNTDAAPGAPVPDTTSTTDSLRALLPGEEVGPLLAGATATVRYDGTTLYRAYRVVLAAESDVSATVTALRPGANALAWLTKQDGTRINSGGPTPLVQLGASRLAAGTYFIVFRDANRIAGDFSVRVAVTPFVVPPQPQPQPPAAKPSILLPPGKNGAAAQRVISCTGYALVETSAGVGTRSSWQAAATYKSTCSGYITERGRDDNFQGQFKMGALDFQSSACTESYGGGVWTGAGISNGGPRPLSDFAISVPAGFKEPKFYYVPSDDAYFVDNDLLSDGSIMQLRIAADNASIFWSGAMLGGIFPTNVGRAQGSAGPLGVERNSNCAVKFTY